MSDSKERREMWIYYDAIYNEHVHHLQLSDEQIKFYKYGDGFLFREVGLGLIPVEDVQKLVEAAELAVDSGFTDGERKLTEALAIFKSKYPGGGK